MIHIHWPGRPTIHVDEPKDEQQQERQGKPKRASTADGKFPVRLGRFRCRAAVRDTIPFGRIV